MKFKPCENAAESTPPPAVVTGKQLLNPVQGVTKEGVYRPEKDALGVVWYYILLGTTSDNKFKSALLFVDPLSRTVRPGRPAYTGRYVHTDEELVLSVTGGGCE